MELEASSTPPTDEVGRYKELARKSEASRQRLAAEAAAARRALDAKEREIAALRREAAFKDAGLDALRAEVASRPGRTLGGLRLPPGGAVAGLLGGARGGSGDKSGGDGAASAPLRPGQGDLAMAARVTALSRDLRSITGDLRRVGPSVALALKAVEAAADEAELIAGEVGGSLYAATFSRPKRADAPAPPEGSVAAALRWDPKEVERKRRAKEAAAREAKEAGVKSLEQWAGRGLPSHAVGGGVTGPHRTQLEAAEVAFASLASVSSSPPRPGSPEPSESVLESGQCAGEEGAAPGEETGSVSPDACHGHASGDRELPSVSVSLVSIGVRAPGGLGAAPASGGSAEARLSLERTRELLGPILASHGAGWDSAAPLASEDAERSLWGACAAALEAEIAALVAAALRTGERYGADRKLPGHLEALNELHGQVAALQNAVTKREAREVVLRAELASQRRVREEAAAAEALRPLAIATEVRSRPAPLRIPGLSLKGLRRSGTGEGDSASARAPEPSPASASGRAVQSARGRWKDAVRGAKKGLKTVQGAVGGGASGSLASHSSGPPREAPLAVAAGLASPLSASAAGLTSPPSASAAGLASPAATSASGASLATPPPGVPLGLASDSSVHDVPPLDSPTRGSSDMDKKKKLLGKLASPGSSSTRRTPSWTGSLKPSRASTE